MNKPSPNYLNDSDEGMPDTLRKQVDDIYLSNLDNLDKHNPKLLVVFSGGNAVGKTTLSKKLSEELGGLLIENDGVKAVLKQLKPDADKDWLNSQTWKYTMDLYKRLPNLTDNGLIIRDGVIDWYYDRILPLFKARGYDLFVIAFSVSKQRNEELIKTRGDKETVTAEKLIGRIDEHAVHQKRFRSEYQSDITLTDETLFDHDMVVEHIKERLQ